MPSAFGYASFQVNIYTFYATPQTNPEYLIGPNSLEHTLAAFSLSVSSGVVPVLQTVTYALKLGDGVTSAVGYYSWLTVDLTTPKLTISTSNEADTGVYDFILEGSYGASTYAAQTSFQIHVVNAVTVGTVPKLVYKIGERP